MKLTREKRIEGERWKRKNICNDLTPKEEKKLRIDSIRGRKRLKNMKLTGLKEKKKKKSWKNRDRMTSNTKNNCKNKKKSKVE